VVRRFSRAAVRAATLASAVTVVFGMARSADASHIVAQQGRAFHPGDVTLDRGGTLTIHNDDEFIHQIYVKSDALSFDSDEQQPGQDVVLKFPAAGTFAVRCHIHPKMLLTVHVK
jgi:plastocyanin